jgi:hypothetical protein
MFSTGPVNSPSTAANSLSCSSRCPVPCTLSSVWPLSILNVVFKARYCTEKVRRGPSPSSASTYMYDIAGICARLGFKRFDGTALHSVLVLAGHDRLATLASQLRRISSCPVMNGRNDGPRRCVRKFRPPWRKMVSQENRDCLLSYGEGTNLIGKRATELSL